MKHQRLTTIVLAAVLTVLFSPACPADLILSVNDVTAASGSIGNTTLEISLTNSPGSPVSDVIAAFQFRLTVPVASGVTFTSVDIFTANNPYIFGANTSAPPLSFTTFPNTDFTASDVFSIPNSGVVLGVNQTVGLGRVTFDVASFAGGVVPVSIVPNFVDSLLGTDGSPLTAALQFHDGSVTVVPEPTGLILLTSGLMGMCLASRLSRRSSADPVTRRNPPPPSMRERIFQFINHE